MRVSAGLMLGLTWPACLGLGALAAAIPAQAGTTAPGRSGVHCWLKPVVVPVAAMGGSACFRKQPATSESTPGTSGGCPASTRSISAQGEPELALRRRGELHSGDGELVISNRALSEGERTKQVQVRIPVSDLSRSASGCAPSTSPTGGVDSAETPTD